MDQLSPKRMLGTGLGPGDAVGDGHSIISFGPWMAWASLCSMFMGQ